MTAWFASSALGRFWDRTAASVRGARLLHELARLPGEDSQRILHDVGLSMSDMKALTHADCGPAVLLPQRLELVGLDAAYLEKAEWTTFHDLQLSCVRCSSWRRCARDLAQGNVQAGLAGYCLNGPLIDSLLLSQSNMALDGTNEPAPRAQSMGCR